MNTVKKSLLVIAVALGTAAFADPIMDGALVGHPVGWYPSTNTPCPRVCGVLPAKAEGEAYSIPSVGNSATYVCKAFTSTPAPYAGKGQLYGNNFNSPNYAPYCLVSTLSGQVQRLSKFLCLCVR